MSLWRAAALSAAIGFAIPLAIMAVQVFSVAYHVDVWGWSFRWWGGDFYLEQLALMIWPSSIGLMALDNIPLWSVSALEAVLFLATINVVLYVALGVLIWIGVKRFRPLLFLVCAAVVYGWYELLGL